MIHPQLTLLGRVNKQKCGNEIKLPPTPFLLKNERLLMSDRVKSVLSMCAMQNKMVSLSDRVKVAAACK